VLLVEDDEALAITIREALEAEGCFAIETACDGQDAWLRMKARRRRPDVILLDLMMPMMDGFGFRKRQLADPYYADIPVIVSSCVGETAIAQMSGVAAILRKPYGVDQLVRTLRTVCDLDPA
jgi:CheY-like chemotaxis protein